MRSAVVGGPSDSAMFDRGVPSICDSLRGIVYSQIDQRGTKSNLHSGVFGGAVVNPQRTWARRSCSVNPATRRSSAEVTVTHIHNGKPWITAFDNPYVRAAGRAIAQGFGMAPVFCREGGSIPVVSTFQEELGVPAVLFGVGLPDENAHAPNERLDLGNFHNGIVASAILYKEVAGTKGA